MNYLDNTNEQTVHKSSIFGLLHDVYRKSHYFVTLIPKKCIPK